MAYLYTFEPPPDRGTSGALGKYLASTLRPAGNSLINVVEDFPWTLTPKSSPAIKETPYIELTEYYIKDSGLQQLLNAYNKTADLTGIVGTLTQPGGVLSETENNLLYENLYNHDDGETTRFSYKLPYFENPTNIQNSWVARSSYEQMIQLQKVLAEVSAQVEYLKIYGGPAAANLTEEEYLRSYEKLLTDFSLTGQTLPILAMESAAALAERQGVIGEGLQKARKALIDLNVGAVDLQRTFEQIEIAMTDQNAIGNLGEDPVLDKPHIWSSSAPRMFNITFPLYNTNPFVDSDALKSISYNWELCYLLTYQNLYNKRNLFTGYPPVFYEVKVPGVYYTKAAYVSNITVLNVGNIRNMMLPVGNSIAGGNLMGVNVPDAYVITMTLVDFFMPSRNFLDAINNEGKRIQVSSG